MWYFMTRYEQGFLTKCAEYGIDGRELLYKQAIYKTPDYTSYANYFERNSHKRSPNFF
jgi:hypothetical protein